MTRRSPTVAVINSNEDTVELLRICLQQEGFSSVVTGHVHNFKTGNEDFVAFIREHDPKVLVYDISIPYEQNWRFLHLLMSSDVMQGRKVVVTTTNKRRLEELVGSDASGVLEIVGKPYDLQQIVAGVKAALVD
jgi:DNA-binding response OmpR family regulator